MCLPKPKHAMHLAQGETVPYIICINRGEGETGGAGSGKGLAARAYHIDEVRAPGAQLEVDAAYYLSQQVRLLKESSLVLHVPSACDDHVVSTSLLERGCRVGVSGLVAALTCGFWSPAAY